MNINKNTTFKIWFGWIFLLLLTAGYFTYTLFLAEDKSLFMPGELSSGHHQIGLSCNACHGESFSDKDAMQKTCIECHGEQRKKPFDSHPRGKFTDPRNADRLENINALYCVTCHVEHKPEITDKTGLSQPQDFCIHCHQDIAEDRPSHQGMEFATCASAGCHNYHNNRALYTDFLVKHMHENDILETATIPKKEFAGILDEVASYPHDHYPVKTLTLKDMDAPATVIVNTTEKIKHDWVNTAHAKIGTNCSACHLISPQDKSLDSSDPVWTNTPDHTACAQCHETEVKHFTQGKHGMRLKLNLPAMNANQARLPMKQNINQPEISCNSCHQSHDYSLQAAEVEACLSCHADEHSLAYKDSPHYQLWQKEQSGQLPEGSGVSCATCHMPRVSMDVSDWLRRIVVQHNQNATLVPNEKMIRPACMNCHGLGFSIDSLADESLIKNNFKGKPSIHIKSIDMAEEENTKHLKETGGDSN